MNVLVVGSINTDFVVQSDVLPQASETVFGTDFNIFSGGKGANQAVAAARLGANVAMIGAVGNDDMGVRETKILQQENIDISGICIKHGVSSGVAMITLFQNDNRIMVVSGANAALTEDDIIKQKQKFIDADVVLCQLEIPMSCVVCVAELAQKYHKPLILNPAPACVLSDELLQAVNVITPNQNEYRKLFRLPENIDVKTHFTTNLYQKCIITCGENGVLYSQNNQIKQQFAMNVDVIDTTGAGDTFNGALARFFDLSIDKAIYYATAAATMSVTKVGARNAMPRFNQLQEFINKFQAA